MRVLVAVPEKGFDPTELGVPCKYLLDRGVAITVCSPSGLAPVACDPIMLDGVGLYLLKWSMRADPHGIQAYTAVQQAGLLNTPVSYGAVLAAGRASAPCFAAYDALLLPGGHCPDMKPYLEDTTLHALVKEMSDAGKIVAAVCHGVVLAARSGILSGKQVTALPSWMEGVAHTLTRLWMGDYYRTYRHTTVEAEVTLAVGCGGAFLRGPKGFARDAPSSLAKGFVVRDGQLLTARWPGDCHAFASALWTMLSEQEASKDPA
jgi:protease I